MNFLGLGRDYRGNIDNGADTIGTDIDESTGLLRIGAGRNSYGEQRPGTLTLRNAEGQLDDRFKQTLGDSFSVLRDKGLQQGDTAGATLARDRQNLLRDQSVDSLRASSNSNVAQGLQNLGLRGGASAGARERIASQGNSDLLRNLQGVNREHRQTNLDISSQDEGLKNSLLQGVGSAEQGIEASNKGLAAQDILAQNTAAQDIYKADSEAFGAIQTANAQRAASGGGLSVICTAFHKRGLISDEEYKKTNQFGAGIFQRDLDTNGHSFKAYNYFMSKIVNLMDKFKTIEKIGLKVFKPFVNHVSGKENFLGKMSLITGDFLFRNAFYLTPKYNKKLIKKIKEVL